MYFTMVSRSVDGTTHTRQVGVMTPSLKQATAKAVSCKGYVVNESNHIIGQAMNPHLPKYIGVRVNGSINRMTNICSGEDSYA